MYHPSTRTGGRVKTWHTRGFVFVRVEGTVPLGIGPSVEKVCLYVLDV